MNPRHCMCMVTKSWQGQRSNCLLKSGGKEGPSTRLSPKSQRFCVRYHSNWFKLFAERPNDPCKSLKIHEIHQHVVFEIEASGRWSRMVFLCLSHIPGVLAHWRPSCQCCAYRRKSRWQSEFWADQPLLPWCLNSFLVLLGWSLPHFLGICSEILAHGQEYCWDSLKPISDLVSHGAGFCWYHQWFHMGPPRSAVPVDEGSFRIHGAVGF